MKNTWKFALAATLLLPAGAIAACYQHPDTGLSYCTSSSECPSATIWNASTQACLPLPSQPVVPPPDPPTPPPTACTITIEYPRLDPRGVLFYPLTPGCDLEGLRLALASAVARLLGPPPY